MFELILRFGLIKTDLYKEMLCDGKRENPKYKILILGDSFIADWHSRDSLYELLAEDLKTSGIKILNTARAGMGPIDYSIQMKTKGVSFKPEVVLLFYYVGNDLTDVQYNSGLYNLYKSCRFKDRTRKLLEFLRNKLYIYGFLKEKRDLMIVRFFDYDAVKKCAIDPELIALGKEGKINIWLLYISCRHKNYLLDNILMETEENMQAWEKAKGLLDDINSLCQRINSKLFIIIMPRSIQIDTSHFSFFEKCGFALDYRTLSSDKPQKLLESFCEERGVPYLDLLPHFKAQQGMQFYKINDDHLNVDGNKFSENLIFDFIMRNSEIERAD
ncbi:MAG: hypothetical protein PHW62_03980 [Candidatus Ratteibacteria bacterium]|nr:hypothetical protein [Candidatus Ratteibacteria bacterium]